MRKSKLHLLIAAAIIFSFANLELARAVDNIPPTPPGAAPQPAIPPISPAPTAPPAAAVAAAPIPVPNLVWDSELKEHNATNGEAAANFTFNLTNVAPIEIVIQNVQTSCGCTVAKLPSQPWHLAPGSNGQISVTVNLAGKMGTFVKQVTANTSVGMKQVQVKITMPPPPSPAAMSPVERERNQQLSIADRQAVFKGTCGDCHYKPAQGKMGAELFTAACDICHGSKNRASMVPDLHALKFPTNLDYWRHWIRNGRPNSMMPAFDSEQGGPLIPVQVASLAEYLERTISHQVQPPAAAPTVTNAASIPTLTIPPAK